MSRLIDADALKDEINAWARVITNPKLMGSDEVMCVIDYAPTIDAEPKWIPCSDRLPGPVAPSQRREWYITSNQYGCVTLTCYEFEASPFKEGWQTDMTILAWMPLPEPYTCNAKG